MLDARSLLVPALCAVVGGVGGGLVVRSMNPKSPATRSAASAEPKTDADPNGTTDVDRRLSRLEAALSRLEQRDRVARAAKVLVEAAQPDDDEGAAEGKPAKAVDDPVFEAAVRDVLDQVRGEQRKVWEDRQRQRVERRVERLTQELGLSEAQKQKVAAVLQDAMQKRSALRDPNGDAGALSWAERRARTQAIQDDADKQLGEILDASQMTKYRESQSSPEGGRGGGGGGRRRRGGGED